MLNNLSPEQIDELINHDPLVIQMRKSIEAITRLLGDKDAEVVKKNLAKYLKDTYNR